MTQCMKLSCLLKGALFVSVEESLSFLKALIYYLYIPSVYLLTCDSRVINLKHLK